MPTNYVCQPKIDFLEMAHTNFFSSIRKTACQPLAYTTNNKKCFRSDIFELFKTWFRIVICLYFVFLISSLFLLLCILYVLHILLRATQPN